VLISLQQKLNKMFYIKYTYSVCFQLERWHWDNHEPLMSKLSTVKLNYEGHRKPEYTLAM